MEPHKATQVALPPKYVAHSSQQDRGAVQASQDFPKNCDQRSALVLVMPIVY